MAIQSRLPLHPAEAIEINNTVSFFDDGTTVAYFAAGVPLFTHTHEDAVGRRVALSQIVALELATPPSYAIALVWAARRCIGNKSVFRLTGWRGLLTRSTGPRVPTSSPRNCSAELSGYWMKGSPIARWGKSWP